MRLFLSIITFLVVFDGAAQKHDYVWLMGQNSQNTIEHAGTVIDFRITPPDIYHEFRDMFFRQATAGICDTAGNLLFYTNGIYIANSLGEPMENGMGLNPGPQAQQNQNYGYILDQGAIILPAPDGNNLYYLLHMDKELNQQQTDLESRHFYYSLINMNSNDGLGSVILKNQIILTGLFDIGKITAVKHANGRDWWAVLRRLATNKYLTFLLTPDGIDFQAQQEHGINIPEPPGSIGQAVFSPDGNKYAKVNLTGSFGDPIFISIFDFNRCSGELSNPVQFTYADTASCAGIAISPNSRFLYVSSFRYLYQYDLWASDIEASRITVAEWDGFVENNFFATTFYLAQLAPDGKIYINSNNSVSYLHVINQPDLPGLLCDVCQHCVDLPSINSFAMPNFPNYRLHHLAGSPCDTLRQSPMAAWGYEAAALSVSFTDSSYHDIRTWHWDFGDGTTDTIAHPSHIYPVEGIYEVCLAVSNPRGADTLCRWVQVLSTEIREPGEKMRVTLSPNPAADEIIVVVDKIDEFHLQRSSTAGPVIFTLYDALGRPRASTAVEKIHEFSLHHPQQVRIDISALPAGVYFLSIQSGGMPLWQGKIVKR